MERTKKKTVGCQNENIMNWLENDLLRLRALEPDDLTLLYAWENNASLWELGNTLSPYSAYVLRQYLENAARDLYETRQLRLMMTLKGAQPATVHGTLPTIGTIDLYEIDPHHRRAGIGLLVDEPYQGKGYGMAALSLMRDYAFKFLGLNMLFAHVPADNLPSLHLFRKAGYQETGILKQWIRRDDKWMDVAVYQLLGSK
jgi:diamine N-acetyltransferase